MPQASDTNTVGNTSTAAEQTTRVQTTASPANKELADAISAAMASFLGQMSQLSENVNLLLSGQDQQEEDSETASADGAGLDIC